MRKICVVTSSRADYGILKPLMRRLNGSPEFSLSVVVTGMHLCGEFGGTYREIEADGFLIHRKIDIQLSSDSPSGMSKTMGMALIAFADYFAENRPDLVILLGDRYEIAAICFAAVNQGIPNGDGNTSERIINIIREHLGKNKINPKKEFYDVDFDFL